MKLNKSWDVVLALTNATANSTTVIFQKTGCSSSTYKYLASTGFNKKQRTNFVNENINNTLSAQLESLGEQKAQKSLAALIKIAQLHDIGLEIRFVSMGELVERELNLNSRSLKVVSYEDDPYFKGQS